LWRVRVTTVPVEKQEVLHIMGVCLYSCFIYLARNSHHFSAILCCHLWPVCLYHISHFFPRQHDFLEKIFENKI